MDADAFFGWAIGVFVLVGIALFVLHYGFGAWSECSWEKMMNLGAERVEKSRYCR